MSTSSSRAHPRRHATLVDAIYSAPRDRTFISMVHDEDDVETMTFGEFVDRSEYYGARLLDHGQQPNTPIVLILPQGIDLMAAFVGSMMIGAIPSILAYPNFKIEPDKYRSGLSGVTQNLSARLVVIDQAFPEELLSHIALGDDTAIVRLDRKPGVSDVRVRPVSSLSSQSDAFIQHSAGTTGLQKGVALTHDAVLRHLEHLAEALQIREDDRICSWLPLYHDMGLIACFMLPIACHLTIVMQSPTNWVLDPGSMLRLITEYGGTLAWVPNFAFQFMARRIRPDDRAEIDLSCLRALINCSEPIQMRSIAEFRAAFASHGLKDTAIQTSYALAENVFAVTQSGQDMTSSPRYLWVDNETFREQHRAIPIDSSCSGAVGHVSSGSLLRNNEVQISWGGELTTAEGVVGEIAIRSDTLFRGYYNRIDLTDQSMKDGWYFTGDLGFLWEGELYVTGRKKDLIIVSGKNIYPQDIEQIAFGHPLIHDGRAVAFGVFNPEIGTEEIVVVAEVDGAEKLVHATSIEQAIRYSVVAELGVSVRQVFVKTPGWIVKSSAGKPARSSTKEKLLRESLT